MTNPIHRRIEGCLLDWVVPQSDVDWWEATKRRYVEAGRADEAPEGDWPGMKAEIPAPWDPSITLRWEIDGIDLARDLYPMRLEAETADGTLMSTRSLGFFASQAEARLFAASLLLMGEQPSFEDRLGDAGFSLYKDDVSWALWDRRLKSGDLSLKIVPERSRGRHRYDREFYLSYEGDKARRILPIVYSCAGRDGSDLDDSDRAAHPTTGVVDDPFVADLVAAMTVADARLALGNIRKPLADGQEVVFIEKMVSDRDAVREDSPGGMRVG